MEVRFLFFSPVKKAYHSDLRNKDFTRSSVSIAEEKRFRGLLFIYLGVIPHSHLQDLVWRPRLLLTTLTAPALGQSYCCDSVLAIRTFKK